MCPMSASETRKITIKLVGSPPGYRDYTAVHDVADKLSVLTTAAKDANYAHAPRMTLLFRGQKITPQELDITFEALIQKVGIR